MDLSLPNLCYRINGMAESAELQEKSAFLDKELEEMFRAGLHFGYSRSRRHPRMSAYIYGIKNNVEVFDLEKTKTMLSGAEGFLKKLGEGGKSVLWVGTKPSLKFLVAEVGKELGHPFVAERWLGGTLTNAKVIRERLKYFEDLKSKQQGGELEKYTKKEQLDISREISKLERYLSGLVGLKNEIDAMVVVDPGEERTAFREAVKVKLPVIAVLSSDNDPAEVLYPIPANDTSPSSVGFILKRLAAAYREGLKLGGAKAEGQ